MSQIRVILPLLMCLFIILGCSGSYTSVLEDEENYQIHLERGKTFHKERKFDDALAEYQKAIEIKPNSADAHYLLGYVYFEKDRESFDFASDKYLSDMTIELGNTQCGDLTEEQLDSIYEGYGYQSEYKEMSIREFAIAAKLDPKKWMAHYFVGVNHLNNNRFEQAIEEYEKALKANPNHVISYSGLGSAYHKLGKLDLAIKNYKKSIELDGDISFANHELVRAYLETGQREKAIEILKQMEEANHIFYDSLYRLIYGYKEH